MSNINVNELDISARLLVVNLHVSAWSAEIVDKSASKEVIQHHMASSGAAKVSKRLISKAAVNAVNSVATKARLYFYAQTLPWKDNGDRVLPSERFEEFTKGMNALRFEFNQAVDKFVSEYEIEKEKARFDLNSLFNEKDYPSLLDIRRKFKFDAVVESMPLARDFRVQGLQDDVKDDIMQSMQQSLNDRLMAANKELCARLKAAVEKFNTATKAQRVHESSINAVKEFCASLPSFNIMGDQTLTDLANQINASLSEFTLETLRSDETEKQNAQDESQRILDNLESLGF